LWVQTNRLAYGISSDPNDWALVPGSNTTNRVFENIQPQVPARFYRMAR
jgi:hypothetical protein